MGHLRVAGIPAFCRHSHDTAISSPNHHLIVERFLVRPPGVYQLPVLAGKEGAADSFPGAPVGLLAVLAGLIIIQFFNPQLINWLVGLIGLKVWLFYIPLYFLGYHLIDSSDELMRMAKCCWLSQLFPP